MIERELNLLKLLGKETSAFLFGARAVGKSYLAQDFLKGQKSVFSIDLLHSESYERYLKSPQLLRKEVEQKLAKSQKEVLTVFIDEIQKVPALLDEVHSLLETNRKRVRFLMSGSSARKLKRVGANLLAGRAISLRLHPLTHSEIAVDLDVVLRIGSLPGIILDNEQPELSLKSYVSAYLREEVMQESLVRKIDAFAKFLDLAAQFNAKVVNATEIAKAAGVSTHSVLEYFQILQDTMLGQWLPGWSASVKKQLRVSPKFYFFDMGVVNALRGEVHSELRESSSRYGDLFESWIIQEVIRLNDYRQLDLKLSYWRTNSQMEVDLILSRGISKPLLAIEIKSSTQPSAKDLNGLTAFAAEYPKVPRLCLCRTPQAYSLSGVDILPWQEGLELIASKCMQDV